MATKTPATDATIKRAPHSKENPYYLASRATAQDERISYQALGLLTHLLSLPDDWEVRVKALARKVKKNGRDFVYSAIKELCEAGYMTPRSKYRDEKGQWVWTPYYVHEVPVDRPQTGQPYTGQPDTAKAEIKTKETKTNYIQTEEVVVVPQPDAEAGTVAFTAETPQPTPMDILREGTDAEQPPTAPIPSSAAPLSATATALMASLATAKVSEALAAQLIATYGEARVRAVWTHMQKATNALGIGFLRSELATPFYVPLVAESVTPANDPTEIDEAEIETQADAVPVDASVETLVDGKETAARKWSVVANQILLKGFRGIKDAQLVGYDASTQTYTVQVPSAHVQQQLSHGNGKTVRATLTGLHAGASVVFVTKEVRHGAS